MGKKKNMQLVVPSPMKIEVKDEIGDNDVSVARDRLKGALREILHHSDSASSADSSEETSSQDYKPNYRRMDSSFRTKMSLHNRKLKRRRQMQMDPAFHHTYVMKLFDRSVDLAQFREDTPLYPICRAWMANQPRNPHLVPKVRSPSPEIVNEINPDDTMYDSNGELLEVFSLPEPSMSEEAFPKNRIPSPVPLEKEELNLDYDGQTLKSKETLMKEHKEHWSALRKKWHQQAHKNEQRFDKSAHILGTIFKKAQSEYE
ncbi:protein lin-37 homolog [Leptopilina boulardi]|uniref:protein lin-37 homolog n=1 Tax=Leptopilina boulardi TaxID=63433 RepID=UPI0021F54468|nr:protein lin-37 homolog [Leptopilina boulardi]